MSQECQNAKCPNSPAMSDLTPTPDAHQRDRKGRARPRRCGGEASTPQTEGEATSPLYGIRATEAPGRACAGRRGAFLIDRGPGCQEGGQATEASCRSVRHVARRYV
jgi:hypothetical protein